MRQNTKPGRRARLSVGSRVTTRSPVSGLAEDKWPRRSGVIVEDYGELIDTVGQSYGRGWAITRRWAVALDDGCLVFGNDEDLEVGG